MPERSLSTDFDALDAAYDTWQAARAVWKAMTQEEKDAWLEKQTHA